ncbi:MAG: hypothetical protein CMO97_03365 [Woeseia sp.]|nr:hypothetical protein [Woeseia sp.]|tara:strand:- start:1551 stop:1874 length:324 start_codon:yes stop_codon:yes gene_type:complete
MPVISTVLNTVTMANEQTNTKAQEGQDAPTEQPTVDPNAPSGIGELNVNDMVMIKSMIELGTQRGAWRANELTTVGVLYQKVSAFVATLVPQQAPGETAGEEKKTND